MTIGVGQTLTQGRRATKSPSEGEDTREAPTSAQIASQRIPLDPKLSISMNYLRTYVNENWGSRGTRRAKAALHLLRMHWQHVPGGDQ